MGRSRITRDGTFKDRQPSRREFARQEHRAHNPKASSRSGAEPNSPTAKDAPVYGQPATPRRHHELEKLRLEVVKEARSLNVTDDLPDNLRAILERPTPVLRNHDEEVSYQEKLELVEMSINRLHWRKRAEAARKSIIGLMLESGHMYSRIVRRLEEERFDIEQDIPRLTRVEKFQAFALDLERILKEFQPLAP